MEHVKEALVNLNCMDGSFVYFVNDGDERVPLQEASIVVHQGKAMPMVQKAIQYALQFKQKALQKAKAGIEMNKCT